MEEAGIICDVCMHHCHLREGQYGRCQARVAKGGKTIPANYGKITSIALDPIEKKPLACFYPGSSILSVGSFGCNLDCPFCQNDSIAKNKEEDVKTIFVSPELLAKQAEELKPDGNIGVAFTYNEPLVGYEYVLETAKEVHRRKMKNVVVTNGSVTDVVIDQILPYIDAYNVDLKGFTEAYYKKLGGDLRTVQNFIERTVKAAHVEVTTLIVPGENDTKEEMDRLAAFLGGIDKKIPLHVTRFFPRRKMLDKEATDIPLLYELAETAAKHLQTVFVGNV